MNNPAPHTDFRVIDGFDNHEMIIGFTDSLSGLKGYIGIHNTLLGPALGGTRLKPYDSDEEALHDVMKLSQAMTHKCALAHLPYGGGKGVIIQNENLSHEQALKAYARVVENLRGLFKTGTDVGISDADVATMGKYTTHMLGLTVADRSTLSTSSCAALGVYYAMKATLQFMDGTQDFSGRRVAIKGVGKLGGELARILYEAGAELIVADTDKSALQKVSKQLPDIKTVIPSLIHKQHVDFYAPCALGDELTEITVQELQTRAIVGGANNQLESPAIGDRLFAKNILYVPDYIANAGGLIYVADELEKGGFQKKRVLERIQRIQNTTTDILHRSKEDHKPTHIIADTIAIERIRAKK